MQVCFHSTLSVHSSLGTRQKLATGPFRWLSTSLAALLVFTPSFSYALEEPVSAEAAQPSEQVFDEEEYERLQNQGFEKFGQEDFVGAARSWQAALELLKNNKEPWDSWINLLIYATRGYNHAYKKNKDITMLQQALDLIRYYEENYRKDHSGESPPANEQLEELQKEIQAELDKHEKFTNLTNLVNAKEQAFTEKEDLEPLNEALQAIDNYQSDYRKDEVATMRIRIEQLKIQFLERNQKKEDTQADDVPVTPTPAKSQGKPMIIAGSSLLVVGLGGVSMSIAGAVLSKQSEQKFETELKDGMGCSEEDARVLNSECYTTDKRGKMYNNLAYAGAAVSAVFLVGGATLLALGVIKHRKSRNQMAFSPILSPSFKGLSMQMKF